MGADAPVPLINGQEPHSRADGRRPQGAENLQYINDLYTPYLRLALLDTGGAVVATSNPPQELQERVIEAGRPTYIFSTAVRDPENDNRVVGVIEIVFDADPQFRAMLTDALPRDENKQIVTGSFGVFADRGKRSYLRHRSKISTGKRIAPGRCLFSTFQR